MQKNPCLSFMTAGSSSQFVIRMRLLIRGLSAKPMKVESSRQVIGSRHARNFT